MGLTSKSFGRTKSIMKKLENDQSRERQVMKMRNKERDRGKK